MNPNSGCLHVGAVFRDIGIADAGQVGGDDSEFVLKFVNQRVPHSRGLCIAVQEDYGRTLPRCEVVNPFSVDLYSARLCSFVRFWTVVHFHCSPEKMGPKATSRAA